MAKPNKIYFVSDDGLSTVTLWDVPRAKPVVIELISKGFRQCYRDEYLAAQRHMRMLDAEAVAKVGKNNE